MKRKEFEVNTSADSLYETSELLTNRGAAFWDALVKSCPESEKRQMVALYRIGAAVVRAIDGLTKVVQDTERSIDKLATQLSRVAN